MKAIRNTPVRLWVGFFMTLGGVVVALVGGFLAWPALIASALGGVSTAQALSTLCLVGVGLVAAFVGQILMGNFGKVRR